MKVSGFSYVRNGFTIDYPFLESIQSILPVCDEFIMVVGDSTDGTREAIAALNNPKIKIVDSVWDDAARENGSIFAVQANIGLDHISPSSDWIFHIQADEAIHENDLPVIQKAMQDHLHNKKVEGFLFHFLNFFGDYKHYCPTRKFHTKEIRIVRNSPSIRSYRDSQGFRKYQDPANQQAEKGEKLQVKLIDARVYHYSYVRNPMRQVKKNIELSKRYTKDDAALEAMAKRDAAGFDYNVIDVLQEFHGKHPAVMQQRISQQDWEFRYDPSRTNMNFKERVLYFIQRLTGKQLFTYKNYRLI
ncbi:glycosyltransferase family 2 protein [Chitinophaga agrisoli]|uniref:Glycosyltransferase family 2 protein n=1 Tax=Chitinophaga agrisoli TaxID=2607653 RepID=A0A5B2VY08_9BACT|nr:glycosyltransferase family 2 protein [Chitinophaga agrisoli]KAA2244743.1 glycosyltransferase family 2 protein [Chitinophaga agrisoli]